MKKRIFIQLFTLLLLPVLAFSQLTNEGNFMIGATVGFSTANSKKAIESSAGGDAKENPSALQINIAPKIGYFPLDNLAVGIGLDYTLSNVQEPDEDKTEDSDLLFGPFGRYFFPMNDDMAVFAEVNFGYGRSSDQQTVGDNKNHIKSNIFAIGVGPGITIFSSSGVGIEAILKYNFARSEFDTKTGGVTTTTTTTTNAFDISVGVQFYFGGVKKAGS